MTTRKDVALQARVSEATVSHVINKTKYVSPELEKRVRDAIAALDYKPNMVARSLVTKTTNHVAILVSDIRNPYFAEITEGMQEVAAQEGYLVSLIRYTQGQDDSDDDIYDLAYRYIDGLLFIATTKIKPDIIASRFKDFGMAIVTEIIVDYSGSVETMIRYLTQLGHRRIAYLSGLPIAEPYDRYTAYVGALQKFGIPYDKDLVIDGRPPYQTTIDSGYEAMRKLLLNGSNPTAVFAVNDLMAIGAMRAIRDAGLKVPDDISVVGCDDIFLADSVDPPLSTLRVPKVEMGRKAMYQLLHQIRENKHEPVFVTSEFILRKSISEAKR